MVLGPPPDRCCYVVQRRRDRKVGDGSAQANLRSVIRESQSARKRMTGRCAVLAAWVAAPTLPRAVTTPRRGHHDDHRDLLFALYSLLHHREAATVRTLDPAIARLLLGRVCVTNDLQPLTQAQQQCAALTRLRFAVQFPAVAAAAAASSESQK